MRIVAIDIPARLRRTDDQVRTPREERFPAGRLRLGRDLQIRRLVPRRVVERAKQRVDCAAGNEVAHSEREPRLPSRVDLLHLALDLLGEAEQLAPVLQKLFARAREFGAMTGPIEDGDAEVLLQLVDGVRHRRRDAEQLLRAPGEAPGAVDRVEDEQRIQGQTHMPFLRRPDRTSALSITQSLPESAPAVTR